MAVAAKAKFYFPTPAVFQLSAAILIIWSASAVAGEPRRCYWCGPLAEQVHRSRRAPSCDAVAAGAGHVTACEPGLAHCAVVASSPPHTESRFCVKLYQDECYPLFCNSTKTWKMTCPCRGDLCNGPNTDRENEAFTILAKLVAKTHNSRIVKRTALNNDDANEQGTTPQNEVTNNIASQYVNESATDEFRIIDSEKNANNPISNNDAMENPATDDIINYTTQSLQESSQSSSDGDIQSDEPTEHNINVQADSLSIEQVENNIQSDEPNNEFDLQSNKVAVNNDMQGDEPVNQSVEDEPVENVKSENTLSNHVPALTEITIPINIKKDGDNKITVPATLIEITIEPMSKLIVTTDSPVNSEVITSEKILTAKTIQQTMHTDKGIVDERTTAPTTAAIKYTSQMTTAPSKLRKNNVVRITLDLCTVINFIVIFYFI